MSHPGGARLRAAKPGKAVRHIVAFKVEPDLASLLDAMHCQGDRRLAAFERLVAYYCDACFAAVVICEDCGRALANRPSRRAGDKSRARCETCKAA